MIRPSTRVVGLVTADQGDDWLVRLFNTLYGFNGLDAAFMPFVVKPTVVGTLLDGFVTTKKTEHVYVAPSLWAEAAAWAKAPLGLVDAMTIRDGGADVDFGHPRALAPWLAQHLAPGAHLAWVGDERVALPCLAPLHARDVDVTAAPGHLATLEGLDCLLDAALPGHSGPLPLPGMPRAVVSACDWNLMPQRTRALAADVARWSILPAWIQRAAEDTRARFGLNVRVPTDLAAAVTERRLRPCQLNDDAFRDHYEHLRV